MKDTFGSMIGVIISTIFIFCYFFGMYKVFDDKYDAEHKIAAFMIPPYSFYAGAKESYHYLTTSKVDRKKERICFLEMRNKIRKGSFKISNSEISDTCSCVLKLTNSSYFEPTETDVTRCFAKATGID